VSANERASARKYAREIEWQGRGWEREGKREGETEREREEEIESEAD